MSITTLAIIATAVLYQNDFSTRTSAPDTAPWATWSTYTYDKGGPAAYDYYEGSSFSQWTGPFEWSSGTVPLSQQDGWLKKTRGYGNRYTNMGLSMITDEDDPALVLTNSKDLTRDSTNRQFIVAHPFKNVFTSGDLKLQFDMRAPNGYTSSGIYSWLGFITKGQLYPSTGYVMAEQPLEVGFSSSWLSGGWRADGGASGTRGFFTFVKYDELVWYRFVITTHIDTNSFDMDIYRTGATRQDIDAAPTGTKVYSVTGKKITTDVTDSDTGIAGIAIVTSKYDTKAPYGEQGYDESLAPKYDNVKVAYKAQGAGSYIEFYRNTFDKSMIRNVDGAIAKGSYNYQLTTVTETNTFWYTTAMVRTNTNYNGADCRYSTGAPYLTGKWVGANTNGIAGADGWRIGGDGSYKDSVILTRIFPGDNWMFFAPTFGMSKQPMCQEVTSGYLKFEVDQRMPIGWNGTPRTDIDLMSEEAYMTGYSNTSHSRFRFGLAGDSVSPAGTQAAPNYSYALYVAGTYKPHNDAGIKTALKPLTWYRLQVIVNLNTKKANLYVYEIGASCPLNPDDFTTPDSAQAVAVYENMSISNPSGFANGIGAWGFTNFARPIPSTDSKAYPAENFAVYIDNIRAWKSADGTAWAQVFENNGNTTKRMGYTKKVAKITSTQMNRPELGTDGWESMPAYNNNLVVSGDDTVIETRDVIFADVVNIGRNIRSGKLEFQYDMRVPTVWRTDKIAYFDVKLGGGTMGSASTWTSRPYRYQMHYAIKTGLQSSKNGNNNIKGLNGQYNRMAVIAVSGDRAGGDAATKAKHLTADTFFRWVRVKVEADCDTKTYDCTVYDMGEAHPTLASEPVSQLDKWTDLGFTFADEPISTIYIIGGFTPSHMPWADDAPGALLLDNLSVKHDKQGIVYMFK